MRKFLFCLLLFLLIGYFQSCFAQWTKYEHNPVLSPTTGSWDSIHVGSPSVINDNGVFKMWYQGVGNPCCFIGYATSIDGVNWNKHSSPVITPASYGSTVDAEAVEPSVIKNGNLYQIWFKVYNTSDNKNKIRYAASNDGINWSVHPNPVLIAGSMAWESSGPTNPAVYFDGSTYHMWYIAAGNSTPWKLGYATSNNGIDWTKHPQNPLNLATLGFVGGPTVLKMDGIYHMWYHTGSSFNTNIYHVISSDGLNWSCESSCSVFERSPIGFDSNHVVAPTVVLSNNTLYLWYGGQDGVTWQIGLATFNLPVTSTPTPTLIPTPSLRPVIIIPGFMASWNKDAILHNQNVGQNEWKMAPFIKEYNGIIETFKNLGYIENVDLFVFTYDWRKSVDETVTALHNFIQQQLLINNPNQIIDIVGHSLGGLIGRIYAQKYQNNHLEHLITVASPHEGTAQVFKAVEAGEIDRSNSTLWLAEKAILILNKDLLETDKETIQKKLPVLVDLLPTYPYLKNSDGTFIPVNNLIRKNDLLINYNLSRDTIFPLLQTFSGNKGSTLFGYTVTKRTVLDELLDYYTDGHPQDVLNNAGDYIILNSSADIGTNTQSFPKDHGELIYTKDAIAEILKTLHIAYRNDQLVNGSATIISPSLLFMIKSAAEMQVIAGSQTYAEQDGIIYIPNPQTENYQLKVKGKTSGDYTVVIGEIDDQNDQWNTIYGNIHAANPIEQIDNYTILYNPGQSLSPLAAPALFDELILYLTNLNTVALNKPIERLIIAKKYFDEHSYHQLRNELQSVHRFLFRAIGQEKNNDLINRILYAIGKLEILYQKSLDGYLPEAPASKIKEGAKIEEQLFNLRMKKLLSGKNKGADTSQLSAYISLIDKKLRLAQESSDTSPLYAEILLSSVRELIKEFARH